MQQVRIRIDVRQPRGPAQPALRELSRPPLVESPRELGRHAAGDPVDRPRHLQRGRDRGPDEVQRVADDELGAELIGAHACVIEGQVDAGAGEHLRRLRPHSGPAPAEALDGLRGIDLHGRAGGQYLERRQQPLEVTGRQDGDLVTVGGGRSDHRRYGQHVPGDGNSAEENTHKNHYYLSAVIGF